MSHDKHAIGLRDDSGSDDPKAVRQHLREAIRLLKNLALGRSNNVLDPSGDGSFVWSATANAASTVIEDVTKQRWGYFSAVIFVPMTANAAAASPLPYVTQANLLPGSMTITHQNDAATDQTYRVVIIG